MKQLSTTKVKNVLISELTCTPNTIILAKQSISERNGEINTSVEYIEVCNTKKTDGLTLIKSLLKYCCWEYYINLRGYFSLRFPHYTDLHIIIHFW